MWEDAKKVFFLGVEVYGFGLYAALGAVVALIVLAVLLRKARWKKGTAPLAGVLSLTVGFTVSRLFLCLLAQNDLTGPMPVQGIFMVTAGGYSMMGALLGASMGAILAAWITRQSASRLLDILAPCLMLFVACERLGEGYAEELFGISRALQPDSFLARSFLAVQEGDSSYLAIYLLESLTALVLALALARDLLKKSRAGDTYLLFLLLFGGTQVLFESLRDEGHMISRLNSFVKVQQVIAILMVLAAVIVLCRRRRVPGKEVAVWTLPSLALCGGLAFMLFYLTRHHLNSTAAEVLVYIAAAAVPVLAGIAGLMRRKWLPGAALAAVLLATGFCIGTEFGIDGAPVSRILLYALYVIAISVPVCLGILLRREDARG